MHIYNLGLKFESIVVKHSNAPAIRSENPGESLTYDNLNVLQIRLQILVEKVSKKRCGLYI